MRMTKGERTKKRIEDASRELFHEKGYRGTLVKDIIGKIGIAPGNLTYYFPTKDTIVVELLVQYINNINTFISDKYPTMSNEKKGAYSMLIFYTNIFSDEGTKRFFGEVISRKTVHYMLHERERAFYSSILAEKGIALSDTDFEVFKCGNVGGRFELLNAYYEGKFTSIKLENFVKTLYIMTIMILCGHSETVEATIAAAVEDLSRIDYSSLKLL